MTNSVITAAGKAFSRQAPDFDRINDSSLIIKWMRQEVREHVIRLLQPNSYILELNAGTGLDALYFAEAGHRVLATDISTGMLKEAERKIISSKLNQRVTTRQLSFTEIDKLPKNKFDLIYSNFGGLNCAEDFTVVGRHFAGLLKPGAHVCLVMISPFCLWETLLALKGNFPLAFRRFRKKSASHLEGVEFTTTYFQPSELQRAMGKEFRLVSLRGLATFTPPPYLEGRFRGKQNLLKTLFRLDQATSAWPLLRLAGDHYVATFRYMPGEKLES